jgi:hypothetical protein
MTVSLDRHFGPRLLELALAEQRAAGGRPAMLMGGQGSDCIRTLTSGDGLRSRIKAHVLGTSSKDATVLVLDC